MNDHHAEFDALKALAESASEAAWAPYSGYRVGAVVADASGQSFAGCNVENASYGLTSCAERNALSTAIVAGAEQLRMLVIYTPGDTPWPPCGACRQVISELMPPDGKVWSCCDAEARREWSVGDLLPDAFSLRHR